MSIDFYRNLTKSFGLIALGIFFGIIAFSSLIEIKDLDLWLHIKMGEIIATSGHVPAHDILSSTIAGRPWVNHEWLFQLVVYFVRTAFGLDGLLYMQALLVVLTFGLLLLWTYRSDRQLLIIPLLFSVYQVYQTRFTVRPDLFSVIYFIIFLMILITSVERRWSLLALMFFQVLWTNMHGYFFMGPLLVALFFLAETIRRHVPLPQGWKEEGALSSRGYGRLCMALAVVILSTLINPLALKGAVYPLKVLLHISGDHKIFFKYITELQPAIVWPRFFDFAAQPQFKVLIIVSTISFLLNIRRINVGLLLVWAMALIFSASVVRNMCYFSVVAYIAIMINFSKRDLKNLIPVRFTQEHFELLTGWMAKVAMGIFLMVHAGDIAQYGYYDFNRYQRKSEYLGISQRMFPGGAVAFMIKNAIKGPIFNDFNSGAYLVGLAYPDIKVFIDGRTEVYGPKFFEDYRLIWDQGDEKKLNDFVDRYHLKAALISTAYTYPPKKVLQLFANGKQWKLVYFADDGLVYLRDIPQNASLIQKYGIDLKTLPPLMTDIHRTGSAQVLPFREARRASFLRDMGFPDQALVQADAVLAVARSNLEAFKVKAEIYADRKDYPKAFENYRFALLESSGDAKLRRGLALAYVGLGEYDRALEQAERLEGDPSDPSGPYVRAKVFVKKKKYQKAYDILVQRIFPLEKGAAEIIAIADFCLEDKAYNWAVKSYALAVRKDPKDEEALKKFKEAQELQRGSK